MGKVSPKASKETGDHLDHQLEEEIGVEVKNLLRAEMNGSVATMERDWSAEERQMFSDAYLGSAVELMIPCVAQERRLMAWQEPPRKSGAAAVKQKKKSASKAKKGTIHTRKSARKRSKKR
ncbi:MAG: hypothetical protein G8237_02595 [Magnetococcales bacterium]|nr:hypothetical protein [Magnetococcales bacterium]